MSSLPQIIAPPSIDSCSKHQSERVSIIMQETGYAVEMVAINLQPGFPLSSTIDLKS